MMSYKTIKLRVIAFISIFVILTPALYADDGTTLLNAVNTRLALDINTLTIKVQNASISKSNRQKLLEQLSQLNAQRSQLPVPAVTGFQAVLPLNNLHKEIFKVQSSLWQCQGGWQSPNGNSSPSLLWAVLRSDHHSKILKIWKGHRWDPLDPFEEPQNGQPEFKIIMARNSVRSDVLNLSNITDQNTTADLTLTGLPNDVNVFRVPLVDTAVFEPVASALIPIQKTSGKYSMVILPGMTCQVWIRCSSENLAAGNYNGRIEVAAGAGQEITDVPASVEVIDVNLPAQLSLWIGGWDYPVHRNAQVTNGNVSQYVAVLKQYAINVTWESGAMGVGTFDANGNIVVPPARGEVNYWISLWPNAPRYACVAGVTVSHTDAEIKSWAIDWANYWQSKGISPSKVLLLIIDEPFTESSLNSILRVGRAIKQVSSFKIFDNIHYADPTTAPAVIGDVMREACDIQTFHVNFMLTYPTAHNTFMQTYSRPGLEWWCYTGAQADRVSDPYVAWLLRAWFCFQKGLIGAHWWAFNDGSGGFSWNEYLNYAPSRTALYLAADSVTTSKSMEAIREGAEDFEILTMLKNKYNQQGPGPLRDAMQNVITNRVPQVLTSHSISAWPWSYSKNRKAAEDVRIEVLRLLESAGTSP